VRTRANCNSSSLCCGVIAVSGGWRKWCVAAYYGFHGRQHLPVPLPRGEERRAGSRGRSHPYARLKAAPVRAGRLLSHGYNALAAGNAGVPLPPPPGTVRTSVATEGLLSGELFKRLLAEGRAGGDALRCAPISPAVSDGRGSLFSGLGGRRLHCFAEGSASTSLFSWWLCACLCLAAG